MRNEREKKDGGNTQNEMRRKRKNEGGNKQIKKGTKQGRMEWDTEEKQEMDEESDGK